MRLRCENTAERIEVLLGAETPCGPKEHYVDGGPIFPTDLMRPSPSYFGYLLVL